MSEMAKKLKERRAKAEGAAGVSRSRSNKNTLHSLVDDRFECSAVDGIRR